MAQKKSGVGTAVAVGTGIAVLSGAAYLLFGPEGKKHRKDLKSWMIKMKADVMEKMEDAKELTAPAYEAIVTQVSDKYKTLKHVSAADIEKEVAELKKNWRSLAKMTKAKKPVGKKTAQKNPAAKKARV